MKGTARVLNLPDSMKDRYDLVDGKIVKKVNPVKKCSSKSKDDLSLGQIILVLFIIIGIPVLSAWGSLQEPPTKAERKEQCIELGMAGLFDEANAQGCPDLLLLNQ